MQLEFMPEPLKDAPLQATGKISVSDHYDSDKPILIGKGILPQGLVTLDGGEAFKVFVHGDQIILEFHNSKENICS